MEHIEIVFTRSKKKIKILSDLIIWYTKKPYSHVARGFNAFSGKVQMYYQASEGKVNYESKEVFDHKHEIVKKYILQIPKELYTEIGIACMQDSGKKYGVMQNLGIVLVDLGICKDTPWKDGRNCSELIYLKVFKNLIPSLQENPDTIKPQRIEEIIVEHFKETDNNVWELKV